MVDPDGPDWSGRLRRLGYAVASQSLDALVVTNRANIRYLSGFAGTAGTLVAGRTEAWLLVDGRYHAPLRQQILAGHAAAIEVTPVPGSYLDTLADVLARENLHRVGFEAAEVTVADFDRWRERAPGAEWVKTDRLVETYRMHKDAFEQDVFRRAGRLISDVAGGLRQLMAPGMSEVDVARAIDRAMDAAGFSGSAFPTIVASGPNSAAPHARPTGRRLASGDLVLLDFGGILDGYCVDLTRMAAIGTVRPEARELFRAVHDAQAAAFGALRAGVPAASVDEAARSVLAARGLAEACLHATGHGLGLEVHEAPKIGRPTDTGPGDLLAAGMVCTVEPGAYISGRHGVRIEDDVLVTADGFEALTTAPRDLVVV